MRRGLVALCSMMAAGLVGCATAGDPAVGRSCPVRVREYPVAEQRRVADLLPSLPAPLPEWIEDYGRLRAEVRAYCGNRRE